MNALQTQIKKLLVLIPLFISLNSLAQDYKANIKQRFVEYNKYIVAGEYNKSMDYLPEVMFTIIPRAQMVEMFEQVMKNKDVEFKITGFDIKEISDSRKIDTCYYAKVKYASSMTMRMRTASDEDESEEDKKSRLSLTTAALANTFGSDNVKLDEATETYTVTPNKSSWAISKDGQTGWKFVNVEPKQRVIMEKILPKVLIEESLN